MLAVCARYRERYREWPAQVRLDAAHMQALARGCSPEGFASIAAHVRLAARDSDGVSAGGRGVIQLDAVPSEAALALARTWLGDAELLSASTPIESHVDYWRRGAQLTLDAFPRKDRLNAEHFVRAQQLGPDRLESDDRDRRRDELLFHLVYLASFGIDGVHPKTLAIVRHSYGWQLGEHASLMLMLHRDGHIALGEPPWDALDAFAADRVGFESAAVRFGQTMTEVARELATE